MGIEDFNSLEMRVLFAWLLVTLVALAYGKTTVEKSESIEKSEGVPLPGSDPEEKGGFWFSITSSQGGYPGGYWPYYDEPVDVTDADAPGNSTATTDDEIPTRDGEEAVEVLAEEETK